MKQPNFIKKLYRASPTILSVIAAGGVMATTVMAAKATPQAMLLLEKEKQEKGDELTKTEIVKTAAPMYIPTVITGIATISCILGANVLNKRQRVAISSAYTLLNASYQEYREKTKELYGEEVHQKIIDSIMIEKAKDVYISTGGLCDYSSLSFGDRNPKDIRLFYDSFSKRYFESTIAQVLEAEYHLNRNWCLGTQIFVNDFYEFLGLDDIVGGDELGWFWSDEIAWIDFDHHKTILEDGLEVYVIDFVFRPRVQMEEN